MTEIDGSTDQAALEARIAAAAALRLQGLSWDRVATEAGYASRGAAYNAVMRYLRDQRSETITELRDLTNARLERVIAALWPKAIAGDVAAAAEVRRYIADFRRHNGLDAPMQVQISSGAEARLTDALQDARSLLTGLLAARQQSDGTHVVTDLPDALEA